MVNYRFFSKEVYNKYRKKIKWIYYTKLSKIFFSMLIVFILLFTFVKYLEITRVYNAVRIDDIGLEEVSSLITRSTPVYTNENGSSQTNKKTALMDHYYLFGPSINNMSKIGTSIDSDSIIGWIPNDSIIEWKSRRMIWTKKGCTAKCYPSNGHPLIISDDLQRDVDEIRCILVASERTNGRTWYVVNDFQDAGAGEKFESISCKIQESPDIDVYINISRQDFANRLRIAKEILNANEYEKHLSLRRSLAEKIKQQETYLKQESLWKRSSQMALIPIKYF